ncbi:MAG TPA: hypothetical protein VNI81_04900 [Candidatus Limnocylindrales bacterium]|jgi:hypothetical protein|nr:hypothetical protein [Candidatus Limnocylindrales bacterium]
MKLQRNRFLAVAAFGAVCAFVFATGLPAQEASVISRDELQTENSTPRPGAHSADGERHGLPVETFAVVPGTRFLVRLESDLSTKEVHKNQAFHVRTLEPLEAGQGNYLPPGAVIVGHISRVDPAGTTGRAKIWLTFDEIQTRFGKLPIVAEVASVPGDHSIKAGPIQEGVIEGRSSTQKDSAQAAAAGAAMGAMHGVKDKNKKEAAEGAALGALEAYLMEAGRGQEIELPKGAKLELELERALYLVRE